MKWFWDKRYALISLYVVGTFAVIYVLKLILDGAAYFLSVIPAFLNGAGNFLGWMASIFAPFLIALVIAYLLDPAVDFFQHIFDNLTADMAARRKPKRKKDKPYNNRIAGAAIVYLIIFLILGLVIWLVARKFNVSGDFLTGLTNALDKTRNQFSETYASFQVHLKEMGLLENLNGYLDQIINGFWQFIQLTAYGILNSVSSAGGNIMNVLMGLIMSFYLLCGKERILKGLRELSTLFMPYRLRTGTRHALGDMHTVFSGYIRGQLTDAFIMAILISVWLSVVRVDFAVIIGIFAGLLNVIPYFGSFIGFLIAVAVALIGGPPVKALYAAIGLLILQQIDGLYINPRVVGKHVEMSPLLVIVALSVGGALFGLPGMILAVPVCAIIKLFLTRYVDYRREKLKRLREEENAAEKGNYMDFMNMGEGALKGFIMERVQDDKKNEAQALLDNNLGSPVNAAALAGIVPQLAGMLKPESLEEIKEMASNFAASSAASGALNKLAGGALGSLFGGNK